MSARAPSLSKPCTIISRCCRSEAKREWKNGHSEQSLKSDVDAKAQSLVSNCEAPADMGGPFQFVNHRNGKILNGNVALSVGIDQELLAAGAEMSSPPPDFMFAERAR